MNRPMAKQGNERQRAAMSVIGRMGGQGKKTKVDSETRAGLSEMGRIGGSHNAIDPPAPDPDYEEGDDEEDFEELDEEEDAAVEGEEEEDVEEEEDEELIEEQIQKKLQSRQNGGPAQRSGGRKPQQQPSRPSGGNGGGARKRLPEGELRARQSAGGKKGAYIKYGRDYEKEGAPKVKKTKREEEEEGGEEQGPNAELANIFKEMADHFFDTGVTKDRFKAVAFRKAAKAVSEYEEKLNNKNLNELSSQPGLGREVVETVKEYLKMEKEEAQGRVKGGAKVHAVKRKAQQV